MTAPPDMLPDLPATVLDDDGAEHRAYLRGVEAGHARGLAEGRGAVVALLHSMAPRFTDRGSLRSLINAMIERIEADGQADPAGVERGRAAAVRDIVAYLRTFSALDDRSPEAWATTIEEHESELRQAREAERQGARGR